MKTPQRISFRRSPRFGRDGYEIRLGGWIIGRMHQLPDRAWTWCGWERGLPSVTGSGEFEAVRAAALKTCNKWKRENL